MNRNRVRSTSHLLATVGVLLAALCLWAAPAGAEEAGHDAPAHAAAPAPEATGHEAHGADSHAAGHGDGHAKATTPHLPNVVSLLLKLPIGDGKTLADTPPGHVIHEWEMHIFLVLVTLFGIWLLRRVSKMRALMPTRRQAFAEMVYEGFYSFFGAILGEKNLKYVPFLGSLFMFIYLQNVAGIIPLFTGGTASYVTTATLAVLVFFYVQINAIRAAGFGHWALHFLGSPKDTFGWILGIFMLPLEIIGALAKPLSLSLRLFGNMMGEHILVGVFLVMGVNMVLHFVPQSPLGIPLHLPFLFLALLTTFIQALVFALLSTIYLVLLLPHDDHHADELHDRHHDEKHGMRDDHHQSVTAGDISPV